MNLFYRAFQTKEWGLRQYMLGAGLLLLIAAAPSILPVIPDHFFSVEENAVAGKVVGTIAPATDSDGDPLYFEILGGNTSGFFALDAHTGIITVASGAVLNFEATPAYSLKVRATADKGLSTVSSTEINVSIQLLDVAELPSVATDPATAISEKAATLHGKARSNGAETTVGFQWGLTSSFGEPDPATLLDSRVLAADAPETAVTGSLGSLSPATTYYYRLVARNSKGAQYGEVKSFTTYSVPSVTSIKREAASPTNADVLKFRVTFSEAVTGVDATDFVLAKSGTANAGISTVEAVSASVYLITVNSVLGDGTLQLRFVDNNSVLSAHIIPTASDFNGGEVYVVDNTRPTITISGPTSEFTQIGPAYYTITYSEEADINLLPAHIILEHSSSSSSGTPSTVTGTIEVKDRELSSREKLVIIKDIRGDGVIRIKIAEGTATDAAGNTAVAAGPSQRLVVDNTPPVVNCAQEVLKEILSGSSCDMAVELMLSSSAYSDNTSPLIGGVISVNHVRTEILNPSGTWTIIEGSGTADASGVYPVGERIIVWEVSDRSLNKTWCKTKLKVVDKAPPVASAPANITVGNEPGICGAKVNYTIPVVDNCSGTITPTISGPASGSVFPIGETKIAYTATDGAGNTTSGSFIIKVVDTEKPVIKCPSIPALYEVKPGESGVIISYDEVTATDNCSGVSVTRTAGFASGALVPPGIHTYTFVARDASGNTAECSFTIRVVNNDPPVIVDHAGVLKNTSTLEDVAKTFSFKVSDGVTAASNLKVSAVAADATLIPAANIKVEGVGADRTMTITPALHRHGASKITLTVADAAGHSVQKEFVLTVVAVADEPQISLAASPVKGKEDAHIPLGITVALVDQDGSESIKEVTVAGVPADAALSAGTKLSSGIWKLTAAEVPGLSLRAEDCHEPFSLQIRAISREASNGDEAESQLSLALETECVNDAPTFTLDKYAVHEKEDFSETTGDVVIKITLSDPDTDHSKVEFLPVTPGVDWVNISVNSAERTIVLKSVKDKNHPEPFTFTIRADDKAPVNNIYEQTFTVQIDTLNDAPYGDLERLTYEVAVEGVHTVSPDFYYDVDFGDTPSNEHLTITLENAPAWLQVHEGVATNAKWEVQLVGTPPMEDEGKIYRDVKAVVVDVWGVKHEDLFDVHVVCTNAMPRAQEEEITITLFMNMPSEEAYAFTVNDDAKALDADGKWLNMEVVEVDNTMLMAESIKIVPSPAEENVWLISEGLRPMLNQYGETEFRIRINDYAYCQADQEGLDENGERTPVYIKVKVIIRLLDVLDIPNLITPNGDGANDTWNIFGLEEYGNHEVKIFDSRGRMIFFSRAYGPGAEWDGTLNGLPMPDGAYAYQIIFNNGKDKREGRITVAR